MKKVDENVDKIIVFGKTHSGRIPWGLTHVGLYGGTWISHESAVFWQETFCSLKPVFRRNLLPPSTVQQWQNKLIFNMSEDRNVNTNIAISELILGWKLLRSQARLLYWISRNAELYCAQRLKTGGSLNNINTNTRKTNALVY